MIADISELTPIARQLNEKSDKMNNLLATINRQLAKLNLGIEIWLDTLLSAGEWIEDAANNIKCREAGYLGYSRVNGKWQLAVRVVPEEMKVNTHQEHIEEAGRPYWSSLLKCSRGVRLAALEQLPKLLDLLNAESDRLVKLIDATEKTTHSFSDHTPTESFTSHRTQPGTNGHRERHYA